MGLEVLVQEVIAAITTSPWPMRRFGAFQPGALVGVVFLFVGVDQMAGEIRRRMPDSATRSCGRIGPAMHGSTVVISSDSVSVKTGSATFAGAIQALRLGVFLHQRDARLACGRCS